MENMIKAEATSDLETTRTETDLVQFTEDSD